VVHSRVTSTSQQPDMNQARRLPSGGDGRYRVDCVRPERGHRPVQSTSLASTGAPARLGFARLASTGAPARLGFARLASTGAPARLSASGRRSRHAQRSGRGTRIVTDQPQRGSAAGPCGGHRLGGPSLTVSHRIRRGDPASGFVTCATRTSRRPANTVQPPPSSPATRKPTAIRGAVWSARGHRSDGRLRAWPARGHRPGGQPAEGGAAMLCDPDWGTRILAHQPQRGFRGHVIRQASAWGGRRSPSVTGSDVTTRRTVS
jgi:hypothetical protein